MTNTLTRTVLTEKDYSHFNLKHLDGFEYAIMDDVYCIYLDNKTKEQYSKLAYQISKTTEMEAHYMVRISPRTLFDNDNNLTFIQKMYNNIKVFFKYTES